MADIYLHLNGEQKGPFSSEQVRAMLVSGEITPDTLGYGVVLIYPINRDRLTAPFVSVSPSREVRCREDTCCSPRGRWASTAVRWEASTGRTWTPPSSRMAGGSRTSS